MNKLDKSKNLEAARVLFIAARDITKEAINKIKELGPSGIDSACAERSLDAAIFIVCDMQDRFENNRRTNISRKVR